jgi:hypothetical protein
MKQVASLNGCEVQGTYYLRSLEHWDRGFESRSGAWMCVRVFMYCVVLCG